MEFGKFADGNNRVVFFSVVEIFILMRLLSMKHRRGEMDRRWAVFTLILNFQLTYGTPSSYGLFHGSANTGPVHRHRTG